MVFKLRRLWKHQPTILLFMDLIQDLDLIAPLIATAKDRKDLQFRVCITDWLFKHSPRVHNTLESLAVKYHVAPQLSVRAGLQPSLRHLNGLITASESTAGPHRSAHALTKRANRAGINTYTLQHGFENIGLTYFDQVHTAELIQFASQKILIWGDIGLLSDEVSPETRSRCITVGCPKAERPAISEIVTPKRRDYLIAIFENLHWHRYSDAYRHRFLEDLEKSAWRFPNTTFLVKPHHGGMWLTGKYKGQPPCADNLVIANPKSPQWEAYTAPALIQGADGVITTPSTVALDAARANCPVSIIGYDLDLPKYNPLPVLRSVEDWAAFVSQLQQPEGRSAVQAQAHKFITRNLMAGDARQRIFDLIVADISA